MPPQILDIVIASMFVFVGTAVTMIAVVGERHRVRIFVWLGVWSALYGSVRLLGFPAVAAALPGWGRPAVPYVLVGGTYLLVVVGCLSFFELAVGTLRTVVGWSAAIGCAIAVAGMSAFVLTGRRDALILANQFLAAGTLLVLVVVAASPRLAANFLVLHDRRVFTAGTLLFAVEALLVNVLRPFGFEIPGVFSDLGFAVLLLSFGYVAIRGVFANERRLLSVEKELEVARRIQTTILPDAPPDVAGLAIAAAYRPMTAVAGDFYDFIAVDPRRVGVLVADVMGHGVPAALIAAMLKAAVLSVQSVADDPSAVLRGLNQVLSAQRPRQLVSAAYLWIDTEGEFARYAASGHPPLLRCRGGAVERIENNGLIFGMADESQYPVSTLPVQWRDRFILYTDGLTDAENAAGEPFGDRRLDEVLRQHDSTPASETVPALIQEIAQWRPAGSEPADDLTLVVIDVI